MCKRRIPMLFIGFSIFLIFLSGCHKTTSSSDSIIARTSSNEVNLSDGIVVNVTLSPETDNHHVLLRISSPIRKKSLFRALRFQIILKFFYLYTMNLEHLPYFLHRFALKNSRRLFARLLPLNYTN